jgi:molybdate transport system substrate-binding protein
MRPLLGWIVAFLVGAGLASAQEVRALCSNVVKGALEPLLPEWERSAQRRVSCQWGASAELKRRADAGEKFDVAILTGAAMEAMVSEGKVSSGETLTVLGEVKLGVGIRAGAKKSDIRTAQGLKQRLLEARSISYSKDGAGVTAIQRMIRELGIEREMKTKLVALDIAGRGGESVANGEYELSFAPVTEIAAYPGAEVLGVFPAEFQSVIRVSAGMGARAKDREGAAMLVRFLRSDIARAAFRQSGMDVPAR